jgi:outer membrane autotransporter protein
LAVSKLAALALVVPLALASGAAMAQDILNTQPSAGRPYGPWYGSLSGSGVLLDDVPGRGNGGANSYATDTGWGVTGAVGYKWPKFLRTEMEFSYQKNAVNAGHVGGAKVAASGNAETFGLAVNGYHDFQTGTRFVPYVGAGLGGNRESLNGMSVNGSNPGDRDSYNFEMHGELGVGYNIGHDVTIGPAYRFTHAFDGTATADDSNSHQFKLGVSFPFR